MAHERCGEEDAEAILSNLKMEGRHWAARMDLHPIHRTTKHVQNLEDD